MFRAFSCRERDNASRIFLNPLDETKGGKLAQERKVFNLNDADLFDRLIDELPPAPPQRDLFYGRSRIISF